MAATIAKALSTAMQPTRSLLFSTAATANSSNTTASSSSSNSSSSTSSNLNSANTTASTASPLPSSASAAPFASAKQALSSRASKLRSRLPSRRVSLLLAAALGLLAAKRYDQVESERRVRTYADKAREIGAQPVSLDWRPRRVRVCVAPEEAERGKVFKPRRHFRDFCKPVFDAAAIELIYTEAESSKDLGAIIMQEIKEARRLYLYPNAAASPSSSDLPLTLAEGSPFSGYGSNSGNGKKGPSSEWRYEAGGMVVVGEEAARKAVQGIIEGCAGSLDAIEPSPSSSTSGDSEAAESAAAECGAPEAAKVAAKRDEQIFESNSGDKSLSNTQPETPSQLAIRSYDTHPLAATHPLPPALAIIPRNSYAGWQNLPVRVLRWFTRREEANEAAAMALRVVREASIQRAGTLTATTERNDDAEGSKVSAIVWSVARGMDEARVKVAGEIGVYVDA